ncbi:hypothetical protein TNCV_2039831 [Trichonephila clavipes]|nr:hypothetical protein TNCV_2039831 [Trichonephila clavipes]
MAAVDFLPHENPPIWAGVKSATLGAEDHRQTSHVTQPAAAQYMRSPQNVSVVHRSIAIDAMPTPGVEGLMYVKSVEIQRPPVGGMEKLCSSLD